MAEACDGELPVFAPGEEPAALVAAMRRSGAAVVRDLVADPLLDRVLQELEAPFVEFGARFANDFNGYRTLRVGAILKESRSAAELIAHPLVLAVADALLLPTHGATGSVAPPRSGCCPASEIRSCIETSTACTRYRYPALNCSSLSCGRWTTSRRRTGRRVLFRATTASLTGVR